MSLVCLVASSKDARGRRRGRIHDAINGYAGIALCLIAASSIALGTCEAASAVHGSACVELHWCEARHFRRRRSWGRGPVSRLVACTDVVSAQHKTPVLDVFHTGQVGPTSQMVVEEI